MDLDRVIETVTNRHKEQHFKHYAIMFPEGKMEYIILECVKKLAWGSCHLLKNDIKTSVHAEEDAITKALSNKHFNRDHTYDIFIMRISKNNTVGQSRPCKNCIFRLMNCGFTIKNVFYTVMDGDKITIKKEQLRKMMDSPLTCVSRGDRRAILNKEQKNRFFLKRNKYLTKKKKHR